MSVTQNYTITMSIDQRMHATVAVMTQLRADRAQIAKFPPTGFDDFLVQQIAAGTETLTALNNSQALTREDTHGALEGALLATVLRELHAMRALVVGDYEMPGMSRCASERRAHIGSIDAVLMFLENPK